MVTAGIFPFKEKSHGRAGNRIRDLMFSSQRLRPLDHEAGHADKNNYDKKQTPKVVSAFRGTVEPTSKNRGINH